MIKHFIFSIITLLIISGCAGSDNRSSDLIVDEISTTSSMKMRFAGGTRAGISHDKFSSAYFFLRLDGKLIEDASLGNSVDYYPNQGGASYFGDENLGEIQTDIDWSLTRSGNKYLFSSDGSAVDQILKRVPEIKDILDVNYKSSYYNDSTMKVIWYVAKEVNKIWHVDGIIVPKEINRISNIDPELTEDIKEGDNIKVSFDPLIRENLICKPDDFLVRIDGKYVEYAKLQDNRIKQENILIYSDGFSVTLEDIQNMPEGKEYTYEIWLWVENKKLSYLDRLQFINGVVIEGTTISCSDKYEVRHNIYKGIGGHQDTPYIKISIHINKK